MTMLGSVKKDLKWRLSDPLSVVLWIGIPLLIGGLMTLVTGGGSGPSPKARLLLADMDETFLTKLIAGAAGGGSGAEFLEIEQVGLEEGKRRIDDGDGSAFVVLPEGFTDAVLDDKPFEIELVTNPSQRILPKILQEGMEMLVDGTFYLQRLAGDLLREMSSDPPKGETFYPDAKTAALAIKINQRLRPLEHVLFPPVLRVEDELTDEQKADKGVDGKSSAFNFGLILFPGILFMSIMFMAQGISYDLWREKDQGTLARLICSPTRPSTFLLAKLIAGTITMSCVAAAGLALGYFGFDLPGSAMPLALVWSAYSGASMLLLFLVVQMLATSSRGANVLTTAVLFPLMMVGGTFFPFEAMPKALANVGSFTPNGISVLQLKNVLSGETDASSLLIAAGELGLIGLVFFGIAAWLLRTRFANA